MDQENLSSAADKFGINYNWGTFSSGIPSSEHISAFSSVNNALHGHTIPQVKIFFERKTINYWYFILKSELTVWVFFWGEKSLLKTLIFLKDFIPSTVLEFDTTISDSGELADIMKLLDDF